MVLVNEAAADENETRKTISLQLTYKLPSLPPITSSTTMQLSPDHHQSNASIPFKWEVHPGKPRPYNATHIPATSQSPKSSLDLPPCRITTTPSPTSVLDRRPKFSSFRFFKELGKADINSYSSVSSPDEEGITIMDHVLLIGTNKNGYGKKGTRGFFGKFKGARKKEEADGDGIGFSPADSTTTSSCEISHEESSCNGSSGRKMRRNGSLSTIPHATPSHLLASIYEGLKHAIQWKTSRKSKKTKIKAVQVQSD